MKKPWTVKYKFIAGVSFNKPKWNKANFDHIDDALSFAREHILEGDEVRVFDRSLKRSPNA